MAAKRAKEKAAERKKRRSFDYPPGGGFSLSGGTGSAPLTVASSIAVAPREDKTFTSPDAFDKVTIIDRSNRSRFSLSLHRCEVTDKALRECSKQVSVRQVDFTCPQHSHPSTKIAKTSTRLGIVLIPSCAVIEYMN